MYLLTMIDFFSHLHPALIHLPIGILLIALLLQLLARKEKFAALRPAIPVILLTGLISAVLSCITGFLLFRSGDYNATLVSAHMWLAIALTFLSFALYVRIRFGQGLDRTSNILGVALFLLIAITGHLGGSLTHGEDYLTSPFHTSQLSTPVFHPIADVQNAAAYSDIVKPILESRCNSCHGPRRQKGALRLDNPAFIAKGGKDGLVLVAGSPDSSELIKRLLLPESEDHHMPPRDKPQLTAQEKVLLGWWVAQGADYNKKVKELLQTGKVPAALMALQHGSDSTLDKELLLPAGPVGPADDKVITDLKKAGAVVTSIAQNSNYLSVNFSGRLAAGFISLLEPLKDQLIQLDLSNTSVGDDAMNVIRRCTHLRYLILSHTKITDKALTALAALPDLRVLNLTGTGITGQGLLAMQPPKHLHAIYLYHTAVESRYWPKLMLLFKGTVLDSGGSTLPVLTTDTAIVRAPAPK